MEREPEITRLRRAVRRLAVDHRSDLLSLTGRRGAGLSALLDVAVAQADSHGLPAALARCTPAETTLPYGVVSQFAAHLTGAGHRLPLRALGEPGAAVVPALCAEFLELARRHPLVLAVDDVQWADAESRRWLDAMAGRLRQAPVLLLRAGADGLAGQDVLHVRPLGERAVGRLIGSWCTGPADHSFVNATAEAAGGSPAVLRVVLDRFARLSLPPTAENLPVLAEHAAMVVGDRAAPVLGRLPADTLALVRAMAMGADALTPDLVAVLAPPTNRPVAGSLALLVHLGLVLPGDPPVLAPGVDDRALAGMSAAERADLARHAAEIGHRGALPDEELAALIGQAPPLHAAWAVDTLRRVAARRRAEGAANQAVALLSRALREDVPGRRARVLVDLALAESAARPAVSVRRLEQVLLGAGRDAPDDLLVTAADLMQTSGDARATGRAVDVVLGQRPDQAALAAIGWLAANDSATEPVLPEPHTTAESQLADPVLAGITAWRLARCGRRRTRSRELAVAALHRASREGPFGPRILAGRTLRCTGDLAEAVLGLDDVLLDARRTGARPAAALALVERAHCELLRGNLASVGDDLAAARTELPPESWHPRMLPALVGLTATHHLAEGDVAEAERVLAAPLPDAAADGAAWASLQFARGCLLLVLADPASALTHLLDCGRVLTIRRWTSPAVSAWRSMAAVAHAAAGRPEQAARLVRDALDRGRRWGDPLALGGVHLLAAHAGGDPLAHLSAAVALLDGSPARRLRELAVADLAHVRREKPSVTPLPAEDRRVAQLAADGRSNADIARLLSIGTRTVEARLTGIYRALGLTGRRQLASVFRQPVIVG